jgi:hypothetical protein
VSADPLEGPWTVYAANYGHYEVRDQNEQTAFSSLCKCSSCEERTRVAAKLPDLISLARRVCADLRPRSYNNGSEAHWECRACNRRHATIKGIVHKPDCLRQAAEAILREVGEIQ